MEREVLQSILEAIWAGDPGRAAVIATVAMDEMDIAGKEAEASAEYEIRELI